MCRGAQYVREKDGILDRRDIAPDEVGSLLDVWTVSDCLSTVLGVSAILHDSGEDTERLDGGVA